MELDRFEVGAQADDTAVVIMRLAGEHGDDRQASRYSSVGVGQSG